MLDFLFLEQQCAPAIAPPTVAAIVQVESGFNPYAISVGGKLQRQPKTRAEAVATAKALEADGWNFSVGAAQVNRHNLPKYSLSLEQAFDPCENLRVGSQILEECYGRAVQLVISSACGGADEPRFCRALQFQAGKRDGNPWGQARITAEAAAIQNENIRMQLYIKLMESEDRRMQQRNHEIEGRIWSSKEILKVKPITFD